MSPIAWALRPLKNYAQFSGRAPRAEFWWFFLFVTIAYMVVAMVFGVGLGSMAASDAPAGAFAAMGAAGIVLILFWLVMLIPMIAVQVRRLHDTNRSGWWIGGFYLLYAVYLATTLGTVFSAGTGDPAQAGVGGLIGMGVLGLLIMIYGIVLLVFYILPGTKGPNKYGSDPYGEDVEAVFA